MVSCNCQLPYACFPGLSTNTEKEETKKVTLVHWKCQSRMLFVLKGGGFQGCKPRQSRPWPSSSYRRVRGFITRPPGRTTLESLDKISKNQTISFHALYFPNCSLMGLKAALKDNIYPAKTNFGIQIPSEIYAKVGVPGLPGDFVSSFFICCFKIPTAI